MFSFLSFKYTFFLISDLQLNMTIQDQNTIHPNVIQDVSTEAPGIVAGELAAEDEDY